MSLQQSSNSLKVFKSVLLEAYSDKWRCYVILLLAAMVLLPSRRVSSSQQGTGRNLIALLYEDIERVVCISCLNPWPLLSN